MEPQSKKHFPKSEAANWSYNFETFTEVVIDTIPNYHINMLPEKHNEALLKIDLATEEKKSRKTKSSFNHQNAYFFQSYINLQFKKKNIQVIKNTKSYKQPRT